MAKDNLLVNPLSYTDALVWYTQLFKIQNLNSIKAEKIFSFVPLFSGFVKNKTVVIAVSLNLTKHA